VCRSIALGRTHGALRRLTTKQSGNGGEAVFLPFEKLLKRGSSKVVSDFNGEVAMNAIVAGVLAREAAKAQTEPHPLTLITLLCGVGLVAALTMDCRHLRRRLGRFVASVELVCPSGISAEHH